MTATRQCPECHTADGRHTPGCPHPHEAATGRRRGLPKSIRDDLFDVHPDILGESAQPARIRKTTNPAHDDEGTG